MIDYLPSWEDDDSISAYAEDNANITINNESRGRKYTDMMLNSTQHMHMQISSTDTIPSTINPVRKIVNDKPLLPKSSNKQRPYESDTKVEDNLFTTREYLLLKIDKIKSLTSTMSTIDTHITDKGGLSLEFIDKKLMAYSNHQQAFNNTIEKIPCLLKEVTMMDKTYKELEIAAIQLLKSVGKCMETRMSTYLTQIKNMREVSNMSIRNAVQNEKFELNNVMKSLKEKIVEERKNFISTIETLQYDNNSLSSQVSQLQMHIDDTYNSEKDIFLREKERYVEECREENEAILSNACIEYKNKISELNTTILTNKIQHDAMYSKLIDQLSADKDKWLTEKLVYEKQIQELTISSVEIQSEMKKKSIEQINAIKAEEDSKLKCILKSVDKDHQRLVTSQQLQNEKMYDKYKNDLKIAKAQMDVLHREKDVKMKHFHQQELDRLLRDNEKLKNIIARISNSNLINDCTIKNHKVEICEDNDDQTEPSPPPPPQSYPVQANHGKHSQKQQIHRHHHQTSKTKDRGWGALAESLNLQASGEYYRSDDIDIVEGGSGEEEKLIDSINQLQSYLTNSNSNDHQNCYNQSNNSTIQSIISSYSESDTEYSLESL